MSIHFGLSSPKVSPNIVSHQQDEYVKRGQDDNQISFLGPIWLEAPEFDPPSQVKTRNDERTKYARPHIWNSRILHLVTMNVLLRFGERTRHYCIAVHTKSLSQRAFHTEPSTQSLSHRAFFTRVVFWPKHPKLFHLYFQNTKSTKHKQTLSPS